jgi:hypothetical protein
MVRKRRCSERSASAMVSKHRRLTIAQLPRFVSFPRRSHATCVRVERANDGKFVGCPRTSAVLLAGSTTGRPRVKCRVIRPSTGSAWYGASCNGTLSNAGCCAVADDADAAFLSFSRSRSFSGRGSADTAATTSRALPVACRCAATARWRLPRREDPLRRNIVFLRRDATCKGRRRVII